MAIRLGAQLGCGCDASDLRNFAVTSAETKRRFSMTLLALEAKYEVEEVMGNKPTGTSPLQDVDAATNRITGEIVDAALAVHRALGPGLLESVYERCLAQELEDRGLRVERQVPVPLRYHDVDIDVAFKADLVVEEHVIVEIKAVAVLSPLHQAQTWTYMKLMGVEVGLLLNFNVKLIKNGIRRIVRKREHERANHADPSA
jgi:GxxExxY protein